MNMTYIIVVIWLLTGLILAWLDSPKVFVIDRSKGLPSGKYSRQIQWYRFIWVTITGGFRVVWYVIKISFEDDEEVYK